MIVVIDRFEGNFAVVETDDGSIVNIPKILVPDAKEGDAVRIEVDEEETMRRSKEIADLMEGLFE